MNSVILVIIVFAGYLIAYHTYGKYLARRIFGITLSNKMPSEKYEDNIDFVPTKKNIVFGHHFTTIAGLGPIVGPAIGIIWGWLPAFLWVFFGSVFMGAVHDFSTLVISARKEGKSIGELTGDIVGPGSRIAFQFIMQFLLFIVLSVFALIVATLFVLYPESVIPVWAQLPIAVWLGWQIKKGGSDLLYSIIALLLMYGTIILGVYFPVDLSKLPLFQNMPAYGWNVSDAITVTWCIALFIYVFFASTLPVQKLLQPRDYINSHQLFVALGLLIIAVFVAHPVISAPAINNLSFAPESDVPDMMPILFIIIACGAISGFHSIASSGTTVKQVKYETDTLPIGYGAMLTEGLLAVLVLISVAAGLGMGVDSDNGRLVGTEAFYRYYSSWSTTNSGIGAKLESFIIGASNLFSSIGIPPNIGRPMIAVFIVSFANTTLDSATRMQRLSLQELSKSVRTEKTFAPFKNRYIATFFVVALAATMTFLKPGGKGALLLWPLFGTLNQLLAALGLAIVSIYLYRKRKNYFLAAVPMLFVLTMTLWSIFENLLVFLQAEDYLLVSMSVIILFLSCWLLISCVHSVIWKKISV
ncbi:MAG: carbon starvation protein A [Bacteroidales bacterium]|nr:carbon starvation protein A [Bacteroidales bacterium]